MLRIARGLALSLATVALLALPATAQDSVAGTWIFTVASPEMGEMDLEFIFEQDGTEVTGTVDIPMPEIEDSELSDGLYEDGILSFLIHVGAQGQWFTVEMEAEVDGNEMIGEAYLAEMGQAMPFTAKRAGSG